MAEYEDDPNANFTGLRYLMDVKTQKQYAVEFTKGEGKVPIRIFDPQNPNATLAPGETVFAVSDEQEVGDFIDDHGYVRKFVNAVVYKITGTLDVNGKPTQTVNYFQVAYDETSEYGTGIAAKTVFTLAPEAVDAKLAGIPVRFDVPSTNSTPVLPAHHTGGKALVARAAMKKLAPNFNKVAVPYKENMNWKISDAKLEEALQKYGRDLTALAKQGKLDPVIGRDAETTQALKILSRRKQSSLCFTGEAGVGKTAMFAAIAQRLVDDESKGELPQSLQGTRTVLLDLQSANAGARFRGDFEERIKPIVEGLAERNGTFKGKKLLLAIDEIHSQLTAGKAEGGSDAGEMMKPLMTTNGVSIMGATTDEEYKKHIEKNPALASRFEKMRLNSPSEEHTLQILKGLWPLTREHNGLTEDLSDADFQYMVTMSNRYAPQEAQPRKGEKVMNMAAASAEFEGRTTISRKDIIAAVAQMSGLSENFLGMNDAERFLKMEEELPKVVVGQPGIFRAIDGLVGARAGLNDPNQPWASYLLQGPTGVGKTQFAKALATYLFGDEKALIKLDMADYQQEFDVSKITGAPPGYVGFEDTMPVTEQIRQRPYSVLLLDEIEKAHPKVFDKFLSILNDGKITDNHGQTVLFNNVIILMTTNLGAAEAQQLLEGKKKTIDWGGKVDEDSEAKRDEELKKIYADAIKKQFRPEMYNRIDEGGGVITFKPLEKEDITKIAKIEFDKMNKRVGNADGTNLPGLTVELSDEVMSQIIDKGYNPAMGARPLRKVLKEQVQNPLGKWLMLNREEVEAFIAKNGTAKLVIKKLEQLGEQRYRVTPELVGTATAPVAANDDKPLKTKKRTTGPKPAV